MPVIPPPVAKTHIFDLSTDVKIEYKAPSTGVFTWNLSAWDNGDKWAGTSTISWKEVTTEVVSISYNQSSPLADGYQQLVSTNVSITLAGDTLNPDIQKTAYTGLPIKITVTAEDGGSNLFFYGRIRSYDVNYVPGANRNEIVIEATDGLDNYLNTLLDVDLPVQTAYARSSAVNTLMDSIGLNEVYVNISNTYYTFNALVGTYTVGEILTPLLQFLRTNNLYTFNEDLGNYWLTIVAVEGGGTADIILTDTELQQNQTIRYYSITSGNDNSLVYNQVKVVDNTDTTVSSKTAADSVKLNGVNSVEFQTNVTSPATNGATWSDAVIADTNRKTYSNVRMNPIDVNGYLSSWALRLPFYFDVTLQTSRTGSMVTKTVTKTALEMNIDANGITFTIELAKPR
jgi:hypothetical protein